MAGTLDVLTSAQMSLALNPPLFQGSQTAVQSLANNTVTALTIDNGTTDTYNGHSNSVNNTRYTAQVAGWYLVVGYLGLAANATGLRLVRINKNGSALPLSQADMTTPGAAAGLAMQTTTLVQMAVGDYVEVYGLQTSGGALNTTTTDTGMSAVLIHS